MVDKKTISFSMEIEEYNLISITAKTKGMSPSSFCKMTAFTYLSKSPPKGVLAELARYKAESQ